MRYTEHSLRGYDEGSLESSDFGSLTLGGPEEDEDVGLVTLMANNEGIIPAISLFRAKSVTSGGLVASSPRMLSHPAATLAMSRQRNRDILSVRELATSGSLTTLSLEGTGKLLPSSSLRVVGRELGEDDDSYIYNDDGEGEEETEQQMRERGVSEQELTEIQVERRMALNQHMGDLKTNVDRNLTPMQKKAMRHLMEDARKQDLLKRNLSKAELRAEENRYNVCVEGWLAHLVMHRYMQKFKVHFERNFEAEMESRRRNVAAKKIQDAWEEYYAPYRVEKKKRLQVTLMKFSFRLLSRLARARMRIAKRRVLRFYADFSRQRFAFVMVKFRFNCVKLQRRIRSYGQCSKARLLVLSMVWNKMEPAIKNQVERELSSDGTNPHSNKWKVKVSLPRFPELSQKINSVTEDTIGLKKTIQKGVNAVSATLPQMLQGAKRKEMREAMKGKRRNTHLLAAAQDVTYKGVVPEADKMDAMKEWLTERRMQHGEYGWQLTRGGSVEAKQLDMQNAQKIISGELDIREHVDYKVNKIDWPTMMMLTDKKGLVDFRAIIEERVTVAIKRKNNEIQKLVRARLQKELKKQAVKLSELPGGYRYHTDTEGEEEKKKSPGKSPGKRRTVLTFGGEGENDQIREEMKMERIKKESLPRRTTEMAVGVGGDVVKELTGLGGVIAAGAMKGSGVRGGRGARGAGVRKGSGSGSGSEVKVVSQASVLTSTLVLKVPEFHGKGR
ncbi:hypothetical protein TrLO_g3438 [Triparma laevis f. longispina]|uniref:Uncharacterized protein n=1 Tax=Triparma laevis f. longispina TaxID=1714387 RepID=A0A9W7B2A0_9STRA|nr:hypothetical protein TrLO_g3438 [Triparma laevis f. longispina]